MVLNRAGNYNIEHAKRDYRRAPELSCRLCRVCKYFTESVGINDRGEDCGPGVAQNFEELPYPVLPVLIPNARTHAEALTTSEAMHRLAV